MMQSYEQMIQTSNHAVGATGTATVGSGLWVFLGENSQAVGAACALIGVVLTIIAVGINWYYRHKASK